MGEEKKRMVPALRFLEFCGGWQLGALGKLVKTLNAGVSVNSGDAPALNIDEVGVLKTSCVSSGTFNPCENKIVSDPYEVSRLKQPVKAGTIIISRMNTPFLVGANAFVREDYPQLFLPDRLWAATIKNEYDSCWLGFLTTTNKVRTIFSSRATGTSGSMKNISKQDVLTALIHYPVKKEQKKSPASSPPLTKNWTTYAANGTPLKPTNAASCKNSSPRKSASPGTMVRRSRIGR